jgi:hypothetical protein
MKTLDTFEVRKGLVPGIRSEKVLKQILLEMQSAGWLAPSTFISPRSDDPLPPEVKIRDEVFELARKVH